MALGHTTLQLDSVILISSQPFNLHTSRFTLLSSGGLWLRPTLTTFSATIHTALLVSSHAPRTGP